MSMVGTTIRLDAETLERADALAALLADVPDFRALGVSNRSKVLRLALERGLASLEEEYDPRRGRRSSTRRKS
jgi:hypothetical protein